MLRLRAIPLIPYAVSREALARTPRERVPEPMVMDDRESVAQFDEAGTEAGINIPIYELCALASSRLLPAGGTVLDLGSGSGRYLSYLAHRRPDARIVGVDLSEEMLARGAENLRREGLEDRVHLARGDITDLGELTPASVDLVSCVLALHHLPSRALLDRCLREVAEIRNDKGCAVWLFDFARLRHPRSFEHFFSSLPAQKSLFRRDALASERAAWTFAELREALEATGLGELRSDLSRPFPLCQVHWAPVIGDSQAVIRGNWTQRPISSIAWFETRVLRSSLSDLPL